MASRIVVAYFGDDSSAASIVQHLTAGVEAIAVVADLGEPTSLLALRDGALAAGAARCHAVDLREEFLREAVLPRLRAGTPLEAEDVCRLASTFLRERLQPIADVEQAALALPSYSGRPFSSPARGRSSAQATVELGFSAGLPITVNGIPMTLVEIVESIETIAGASALPVLQKAYAGLGSGDEGLVRIAVSDGAPVMVQGTAGCR